MATNIPFLQSPCPAHIIFEDTLWEKIKTPGISWGFRESWFYFFCRI